MKKKMMALVLAVVMLGSLILPAMATEDSMAPDETMVLLNGEHVSVKDFRATKSKAIFVIPGILGSELKNSSNQTVWVNVSRLGQMTCNSNGYPSYSLNANSDDYGVLDIYKNIVTTLSSNFASSYDIIYMGYDFRLSNATAASRLQTLANSYSEINLVAHSMGGLVASKYMAMSTANKNKVKKLITVGTPYTGAVKVLLGMESGRIELPLGIENVVYETIQNYCRTWPSCYELLPTSRSVPYLTNNTGKVLSVSEALTFIKQRPWAKNGSSLKPMWSTAANFHSSLISGGTHIAEQAAQTYYIYGSGTETLMHLTYKSPATADTYSVLLGVNNSGDGTVTKDSATNRTSNTAKTIQYSYNHIALITNSTVINKIVSLLNGTRSTADETSFNYNARGWISNPEVDGRRIAIELENVKDISISKNGQQLVFNGDQIFEQDQYIGTCFQTGEQNYYVILSDGEYDIQSRPVDNNATIKAEYMDKGYYDKVVVYSDVAASNELVLRLGDVNEQSVQLLDGSISTYSGETEILKPDKEFTEEELAELNVD